MKMKNTRDLTMVLFISALIFVAAGQVMAQDQACPDKILMQTAVCTHPPGSTFGCEIWKIIFRNSEMDFKIISCSYTDNSFSARIQSTDASGNKRICIQTETRRLGKDWRISGTRIETPTRLRVNTTGPVSILPAPPGKL
jgi:hypothetical protein